MFALAASVLPWRLALAFTTLDCLLGGVIYFLAIRGKFRVLRCVPRMEFERREIRRKAA
jgi:hypothetical protein